MDQLKCYGDDSAACKVEVLRQIAAALHVEEVQERCTLAITTEDLGDRAAIQAHATAKGVGIKWRQGLCEIWPPGLIAWARAVGAEAYISSTK